MPLTLAEADKLIDSAHTRARELGIRIAVAVVDEGGLLISLRRMDGAFPLSSQLCEAKAVGAAVWHRDGASLAELQAQRPEFFAQVDRFVRRPLLPAQGSLLIRREGAVLGAVGISGAASEVDADCAHAGLRALGLD